MAVGNHSSLSKIEIMKEGGAIMKIVHSEVKNILREGMDAMEIEELVKNCHKRFGLGNQPADGYNFPGHCCISINDCLCHGVPENIRLKAGDIVSVDIFFNYKGYCIDCCRSYVVCNNQVELEKKYKKEEGLIRYNELIVDEVIDAANKHIEKHGEIRYSFFGNYIYRSLMGSPYCVSHEYGGHTIAEVIHAGLCISSSIINDQTLIKEGDTFCVEPIISYNKRGEVHIRTKVVNSWFVINLSGEKTSHWENTYVMENKKIISLT